MVTQPILPSGIRTTSGSSQSVPIDRHIEALVYLDVTAVSGTTPTLDVKVETSPDDTRWFTHTSFTQITTVSKNSLKLTILGAYVRITYTIAGTTPSFTFQADIVFK